MQDIKQLSLIFMKSLNLNIKYRIRINIYSIILLDVFSKTKFILVLNIHKLLLILLIVHKCFQFAYLFEVRNPFFTYLGIKPLCKKRITMSKESSLSNTICLIVELLWIHFIEILQFSLLKNLGMKSCNTIY